VAATFVQADGAQGSGGTSISINLIGVTAGNHLSTVTTTDTSATAATTTSTPSATWNTAVADVQAGTTDHRFGSHYTENLAAGGSWTVTGHASATCNLTTVVVESAGVATTSSLGVTGSGSSATSTVSLSSSITPSAGSILIAGGADRAPSGSTAAFTISSTGNSPFTVDEPGGAGTVWDETFSACGTAHFDDAAAVATNITWTSNHSPSGMAAILMEFLAAPTVPLQAAYPASDVTDGTWTNQAGSATNLFASIDEPDTPSDTDYIQSVANPTAELAELGLASLPDPQASDNHSIIVRAFVDALTGGDVSLTTELRQGASALSTPASWIDTLTDVPTNFSHALSAAQADAITNYGDLRLRFTADQAAPVTSFPTFVDAGAGSAAAAAALTVPWPTSPMYAVDDIGLLFIETAGGSATPTLSTAAGFAAVTGGPASTGSSTAGTKLHVFWCRATSTSQASPVISSLADHTFAVILTFRGCVKTGNPWSGTPAWGTKATASTTTSATGLTTTDANCLVVGAVTKDLDSASAFLTTIANSNLANRTERFDLGTTSGEHQRVYDPGPETRAGGEQQPGSYLMGDFPDTRHHISDVYAQPGGCHSTGGRARLPGQANACRRRHIRRQPCQALHTGPDGRRGIDWRSESPYRANHVRRPQ
jgi:hypothetical protein